MIFSYSSLDGLRHFHLLTEYLLYTHHCGKLWDKRGGRMKPTLDDFMDSEKNGHGNVYDLVIGASVDCNKECILQSKHLTIEFPPRDNLTLGSYLEKLLRVEGKKLNTWVPTESKTAKISGETASYETRKETGYAPERGRRREEMIGFESTEEIETRLSVGACSLPQIRATKTWKYRKE